MPTTETRLRPEISPGSPARETGKGEFFFDGFQAKWIQHVRLLWSARQALAKSLAVGLGTGILLAFLLPKRYQSSTQLMPPDNNSNSQMLMAALASRTGNGLGAVAGDLLGLRNSGALFVGILRSATVEDRLVQRFDLKRVYGDKLELDARTELADNSGISEDRKSGIILITVTDRDPRRAAALAQAYVEELNRLAAELSTSAAHRERVFLEERLKTVKQDLDQAQREFSEFASKNTAIDIKEQGRAMVDAAARLQGQLIAAESELKGLEQIYTPSNVRVRSVQARISELNRQLQKLGGKGPEEAVSTVNGPSAEESLYPSIRELPMLGVPYADLYRRTKIEEVVFETLTQEYELAKVEEAKETPSVKVLDVASVPEKKSSPARLQIIVLCGVLVLSLGAVWIVMGKRWEELDPEDERKVLAQEIFQSFRKSLPWASANGSRLQTKTHEVWSRWVRADKSEKHSE